MLTHRDGADDRMRGASMLGSVASVAMAADTVAVDGYPQGQPIAGDRRRARPHPEPLVGHARRGEVDGASRADGGSHHRWGELREA